MVLGEDGAYSVRLQSIAGQLSPAPILGALEARLAWYEEAYAEAMACAIARPTPAGQTAAARGEGLG